MIKKIFNIFPILATIFTASPSFAAPCISLNGTYRCTDDGGNSITANFQSAIDGDSFAYNYNGLKLEADAQYRQYAVPGEGKPVTIRAFCDESGELVIDEDEPTANIPFWTCANAGRLSTIEFVYSNTYGQPSHLMLIDAIERYCGTYSEVAQTNFYTCESLNPAQQ